MKMPLVAICDNIVAGGILVYRIRVSKGAYDRLRGQIAQNVLSCRASSYGVSKYFGKTMTDRRNRPTFAIRAQVGLFGTSMSRNCWVLNEILRNSHIPTQDSFVNILCNLLS